MITQTKKIYFPVKEKSLILKGNRNNNLRHKLLFWKQGEDEKEKEGKGIEEKNDINNQKKRKSKGN